MSMNFYLTLYSVISMLVLYLSPLELLFFCIQGLGYWSMILNPYFLLRIWIVSKNIFNSDRPASECTGLFIKGYCQLVRFSSICCLCLVDGHGHLQQFFFVLTWNKNIFYKQCSPYYELPNKQADQNKQADW